MTSQLKNLYMAGMGKKKRCWKINLDEAYYILVDTVTKYDWLNIMKLSVAKIKSFFSNTPVNMQEIIKGAPYDITITDIEEILIGDAG